MNESSRSEILFQEAQNIIPGGVNSPVRACRAVDCIPRFVAKGQGARLWDVDGKEYLDFVASWGPMILGHAHPSINKAISEALEKGSSFGAPTEAETILACLIAKCFPSIEMVRLVNSGTEAAMTAIRLARGATGRDKIVKFVGCYHGHADSLLVAAGSGLATFSLPGSLGVPKALAELTITCPYNDTESLSELFKMAGNEIAAVIVEPVAGNMGLVLPKDGFLETIAELCRFHGSIFICDEVISGFRVSLGGAQGLYKLKPDLTVLGKIIGGGLPLAAFGGRRDLMEQLAPLGGVYQAGTLSGNPLAVAAGIAALKYLISEPDLYDRIRLMSEKLVQGLLDLAKHKGLPATANQLGSLSTLFFTEGPVFDFQSACQSDTKLYSAYYRAMLSQGLWLAPSQFETTFVSASFLSDDIDLALERATAAFKLI